MHEEGIYITAILSALAQEETATYFQDMAEMMFKKDIASVDMHFELCHPPSAIPSTCVTQVNIHLCTEEELQRLSANYNSVAAAMESRITLLRRC